MIWGVLHHSTDPFWAAGGWDCAETSSSRSILTASFANEALITLSRIKLFWGTKKDPFHVEALQKMYNIRRVWDLCIDLVFYGV